MSKPRFGNILTVADNLNRDAVHIPIIPVAAGRLLHSGERIHLVKGSLVSGVDFTAYPAANLSFFSGTTLGVVDPFITTAIQPGDIFYAWLPPESTEKLWHEWTHRKLDKKDS